MSRRTVSCDEGRVSESRHGNQFYLRSPVVVIHT